MLRRFNRRQHSPTNVSGSRSIVDPGPLLGAPPLSFCCLSQPMSAVPDQAVAVEIDDDRKLGELGYIPSFKREFSNLPTVRRRFPKKSRLLTSDKTCRKPFRLASRSIFWYFPSTSSQKPGRLPGRMLECLCQHSYDIQHTTLTRRSSFGLSRSVTSAIAPLTHATTP